MKLRQGKENSKSFLIDENHVAVARCKKESDRQHIIKCVNSHDALVQAGSALLDFCEQYDLLEWVHGGEKKIVEDFRKALEEAQS